MKRIVLLSTGGTIASAPAAEGRSASGALPGETLIAGISLDPSITVSVRSVFQKPSNSIGYDEWVVLRRQCEELMSSGDADGIVITHGTDTLEETAYYLDCVLDNPHVPVVVTGSQRVPAALGTDAYANLQHAIEVAASEQARGLGVLVLFNESIFSAGFVRKVSSFQVNGFDSPGLGCLGYIDNGEVTLLQRPMHQPCIRHDAPLRRVDIVLAYPGADTRYLAAVLNSEPAGLVIDALGRGHVPPSWMPLLRDAIAGGMTALACSSTLHGGTHQSYEFPGSLHDLEACGVIPASHLTARKARVRLAILLAAGMRDPGAIRDAFRWQRERC